MHSESYLQHCRPIAATRPPRLGLVRRCPPHVLWRHCDPIAAARPPRLGLVRRCLPHVLRRHCEMCDRDRLAACQVQILQPPRTSGADRDALAGHRLVRLRRCPPRLIRCYFHLANLRSPRSSPRLCCGCLCHNHRSDL